MSEHPLLMNTTSTVLVFDGDCAFCTTWINRLRGALSDFPQAEPYQWIDLDSFGLSLRDVENYAWFITPERQFAGHLAFAALLRTQRSFGYRFLGRLIATPPFSWVAALAYRFIAANRHRLPGGTPACQLAPATGTSE